MILCGVSDIHFLRQGGAVPVSSVSQLGTGKEKTLGDHGDHQVTLGRRLGRDELFQSEFADHCQNSFHMAVWTCAGNAEGLSRRYKALALEGAFDDLDEVLGEMGKVAESLVGDGLALADGSPEQMSDVGLTLVDPPGRGHMYGAASCWHAAIL